jgi:plasmid stabilization system protein ParE
MVRRIVWNKRAEKDLDQIVEYLRVEWGDKVTRDYLQRIRDLTNLLSQYPEIGTVKVDNKDIRAFLPTKHATLIYKVDPDKITILNIFDNRQDPRKAKYQ